MDMKDRRHRSATTGHRAGVLLALSVVLALVLAACGSSDEPTAESTTTTSAPADSSATTAVTETTAADAGGGMAEAQELTIGMGAILRNFDPASTQAINDYVAIRMVYDTLTTLDNGAPEPWAAESWEAVSPTQWRFTLREGMEFTNGEPFDAEAVRYTFQRALDSADNPWRVRIEALESMTVVDDRTIEFNLNKPVGNWPSRVAIVWIVPPVYSESNDITLNPLGSGPFKVDSFTPGEEVVYSANPDWWNGAPILESVTLQAIPENATRVASLLAGDVGVAYKILPDQVPQVEEAGFVLDSVPSGFLSNLFFQSSRLDEPIGDVRVRQAIDFAIDKEGLREFIAGGYGGDVQGQAVGPNSIGHNPDVSARPYDPDQARALLAEAGYADGLTIGFDYSVGRYFADKEIAEAVIGYLDAVGITVEGNAMEGGAWLDKIYSGEWGPISFWSYQDAPFYDLSITTEIFKSDGFRKITADTEIDRYIDESFAITDPQERADHLAEYGKYLVDNAYIVPLYHDPGLYAYAPDVRDIVILPSTMINLWDTYIADE